MNVIAGSGRDVEGALNIAKKSTYKYVRGIGSKMLKNVASGVDMAY